MFDFNRLKRIFDPMLAGMGNNTPSPTYPSNSMQMRGPEPIVDETINAEVEDPYSKHDAQDRLSALIQQMPNREPASKLRRIGNLLVSAVNGPEQASKLFDMPFQQKLSDWNTKLKPAEYEANLERQNNTQGLTELRISEIERKNREAEAIARAKLAQAPELIDRRTEGQVRVEGVKQPNRIEAIEATGDQARQTEGTRQTGRETLAETTAWTPFNLPDGTSVLVNPTTGQVKPLALPEGSTGPLLKPGTGTKTSGNQTPEQLQSVQDKTREAITIIDRLVDEDGKIRPEALMAFGGSRLYGLTTSLPAGMNHKIDQGKAANADIDELKSRMIISLIQEMKAQSRTGATGFGALNLKELGVLEKEFAGFDPNNPEEKAGASLKALRDRLSKILLPAEGSATPITTTNPDKTKVVTPGIANGQIVSKPVTARPKESPEELYKRLSGGQ